ncbi:MAG: 30S ribosomal protein S6 [Dehalococcoidia bacterium]|nr:30S ribosomal protein S6 [Dehalococcoidia bacterium]
MVRNYELLWIIPGSVSEGDGAASIERIKTLITARGGQALSAEFWARRTLAFAIKGNKEGAYFIARFSMDGKQVPDFERALLTEQTVIRHMLVKAEEVQPSEPKGETKEAAVAGSPSDRSS